MIDEDWCNVIDADYYAVSNHGRVWNTKFDKLMKTRLSNIGYETVGLLVNGKQHTFLVHRLVAIAFIPHRFGANQVNHIDGDKTYNVVDNLEWVTCSENHLHAFRNGLKVAVNRRRVRIVETGEEFESLRACARAVGGIVQGVHNNLAGQNRSYKGYTYEYIS